MGEQEKKSCNVNMDVKQAAINKVTKVLSCTECEGASQAESPRMTRAAVLGPV